MRPLLILPLSLPVLMLACSPSSSDDDDGDGEPTVYEGILVDVEMSDSVTTVPIVTWEFDDGATPDAAWIEVGGLSVPVDLADGPPWETAVIGLAPEQDFSLQVVAEVDGEALASTAVDIQTGAVSNRLPVPDVELFDEAAHADGYLVTSIYASPPAAVILNADGEYVWWHIEDDNDFQVSRAWLRDDRSEVLYWTENVRAGAPQELVRIGLDGEETDRISLPDGHHDFHELSDGRIAFLEYDIQSGKEGDRISVLDLETEQTEVIWSVWDDVPSNTPTQTGQGEGWSHANSIQTDGTDIYLTFLGFEGIGKVNLAAGELEWVFSGVLSDFTDASGSTDLLERPHNFQVLDGGLLCFENGDQDRRYSRVLEYALDEDSGEAELVWSYTPSPDAYTFSLGDTHRLSTGQTIMAVALDGQVDEVSPDGDLVWRLSMELGGALGYSWWIEDLY